MKKRWKMAWRHSGTTLAPLGVLLALALPGSGKPLGVAAGHRAFSRPAQGNVVTVLTEEKGKFRILVQGQPAGKEEFEISRHGDDWVAHGTAEIQIPQTPTTRITSDLRLRPDGTPVRYEWTMQGAKKASASVDFQGGTASVELRLEGSKPFTQQFFFNSPHLVVLDNNLYHQYAILARLYDWEKKGAQTFPVLIPQEMTPGNITVESLGPQDVEGAKLELLRVHSEDLSLDLLLNGRKLVRIVSPSANAVVIRE
jgi:hypothetical protein